MNHKTKTPDHLHIGKTIRKHLEEVGMTKSEFSRRIGTSPQNVYGIFKRKSIDTEVLKDISRVLDFDFFQYYSNQSLVIDGKAISAKELKEQIEAARTEIAFLKKENGYLDEIRRLHNEK